MKNYFFSINRQIFYFYFYLYSEGGRDFFRYADIFKSEKQASEAMVFFVKHPRDFYIFVS